MSGKTNILIVSGGGTGGHVSAGIAIASEWVRRFGKENSRVLFVGAKGGIEERMVPRAGIPLELLSLGTLNRVSMKQKLKTFFQLPWSLVHSTWILLKIRPQAVIGVGGYASGPILLCASLLAPFLRLRTAVLEQNSVSGLTNRILEKFVRFVFLSFPEESPYGSRRLVTGNPIRQELQTLPPARLQPFRLFVFGGSRGARGINLIFLEIAPDLLEKDPHLEILHQTGDLDFEMVNQGYAKLSPDQRQRIQVVRFIDDMESAYRQSSLIVCRAGASSLFELACVARAAILIPFPFASDNHQLRNAEMMVEHDAAILIEQQPQAASKVLSTVFELRENAERIHDLEKNIQFFRKSDAAKKIVDVLSSQS